MDPSTPSISFKKVDKTRASADVPLSPALPIPCRFWSEEEEEEEVPTMESISSKKMMQGEAALARANARRTTASASPTYELAYTSAGDRERNATPDAPAAARASVV